MWAARAGADLHTGCTQRNPAGAMHAPRPRPHHGRRRGARVDTSARAPGRDPRPSQGRQAGQRAGDRVERGVGPRRPRPSTGAFPCRHRRAFSPANLPNLVSLCPCASLSLFLSPFLSLSGSPPPLCPWPPGGSVTSGSSLPVPTPRAGRWGPPGRMPRSNLHLDPWLLRVRASFLVTAEPRDPQLPAIPTPSPALPGHWAICAPPPASKLSLCAPCMKFHRYGLPCIGAADPSRGPAYTGPGGRSGRPGCGAAGAVGSAQVPGGG